MVTFRLKYLFILLLLHAAVVVRAGGWDDAANSISIRGASNVNEFELHNNNPVLSEPINTSGRYRNIRIAVDGFSAENKKMLDDFKKMVDAPENPYILIAIEKRALADFEETSGLTSFNTIITIAGETAEYNIPMKVNPALNSGYTLQGKFSLKLTDFGIEPPEKLFGLVKVKNDVFINFTFNFDAEESLTENQ